LFTLCSGLELRNRGWVAVPFHGGGDGSGNAIPEEARREEERAMSFDLGVWYSDVPMTKAQAAAYYEHISSDWVDVRRRTEFDAFLSELVARFRDLRSPDDQPADPDDPPDSLLTSAAELKAAPPPSPEWMAGLQKKRPTPAESPWAATLGPIGSSIALSITWGRVPEVAPIVVKLAARFNLIVYDPQESRVFLAPEPAHGKPEANLLPPRVRLLIDGDAPRVHATIKLDDRFAIEETMPSRREAHRRARALTLENGLGFYAVDDRRSLAQAMIWALVPDGELPGVPRVTPSGDNIEIRKLKLRDEKE
jgi:hypothetical protein